MSERPAKNGTGLAGVSHLPENILTKNRAGEPPTDARPEVEWRVGLHRRNRRTTK